jgi:hypothetical protein
MDIPDEPTSTCYLTGYVKLDARKGTKNCHPEESDESWDAFEKELDAVLGPATNTSDDDTGPPIIDPCSSYSGSSYANGAMADSSSDSPSPRKQHGKGKNRRKRKRSPTPNDTSSESDSEPCPGPSADTLDRKLRRAKAKAKARTCSPELKAPPSILSTCQ